MPWDKSEDPHQRLPGHQGRTVGWCLGAPGLGWLLIFTFVPLVLVLGISFAERTDLGELRAAFTLESYRRLAGWSEFGFDPLYPRVLTRTLLLSVLVTGLVLVASLPLAFFVARLPPRSRSVALALLVVPFWTNLLIRTYAWQIWLGAEGPVVGALQWLGWVGADSELYPGWTAVGLAMFCDFLPFMALPIYASAEKLDWALAEAAADLGAGRWGVFRHGLLPQLMPGIRAGVAMVFLPLTGQFVIPDLLGGGRTTLWGNLIQQQFGASRDWPLGAAASMVVLCALVAVFWWWRGRGEGLQRGPWI